MAERANNLAYRVLMSPRAVHDAISVPQLVVYPLETRAKIVPLSSLRMVTPNEIYFKAFPEQMARYAPWMAVHHNGVKEYADNYEDALRMLSNEERREIAHELVVRALKRVDSGFAKLINEVHDADVNAVGDIEYRAAFDDDDAVIAVATHWELMASMGIHPTDTVMRDGDFLPLTAIRMTPLEISDMVHEGGNLRDPFLVVIDYKVKETLDKRHVADRARPLFINTKGVELPTFVYGDAALLVDADTREALVRRALQRAHNRMPLDFIGTEVIEKREEIDELLHRKPRQPVDKDTVDPTQGK